MPLNTPFDVKSHLITVDAEFQVVVNVEIGWRLLERAVDILEIFRAAFKVLNRGHLVVDLHVTVADDVDAILTACEVLPNRVTVSVGKFNAGVVDAL